MHPDECTVPSIHAAFTEPSTPHQTAEDIFTFSPSSAEEQQRAIETIDSFLSVPLNDTDLNAETEQQEDTEEYEHVAWGLDALINEAVIKSGFLLKKGEKRKTWKKRWFVLKSTKLAYYKNEKEYELLHYIGTFSSYPPLTSSELDSISAAALITSKKQCFALVTKTRTYHIQADDEETMLDWVWEIQNALKQRRLAVDAEQLGSSHNSTQLRSRLNRLSVNIEKDPIAIIDLASSVYATASAYPADLVLTPLTSHAVLRQPSQLPTEPESSWPDSQPQSQLLASFRSPSSATIQKATAAFVKNNPSALSGTFTITVPAASLIQPILVKRQSEVVFSGSPNNNHSNHFSMPSTESRKSFLTPHVDTSLLPPALHHHQNSQTQIITPAQPTLPSSLPVQSALRDVSTPIQSTTPKNVKFQGVALSADILAFQKCDFGDEFSSEEDLIDELMSSQGSGLVIRSRVLHQGYLEKQRSSLSKGWSVRWFVLRNNRLVCYKDDKEYETRRVIEMRDVLDVIEVDSLGKSKNYCFKVVLHKKSLYLCADTQEIAQEWIQMLKKVHAEVGQKVLLN